MARSKKQGYVMYKAWNPVIRNLPEAAAGQLFHAIAEYQDGEEPQIDDPMLCALFTMIRQTFEADEEKYQRMVERNRENGQKGGRPRKESPPDDPFIANGFSV